MLNGSQSDQCHVTPPYSPPLGNAIRQIRLTAMTEDSTPSPKFVLECPSFPDLPRPIFKMMRVCMSRMQAAQLRWRCSLSRD